MTHDRHAPPGGEIGEKKGGQFQPGWKGGPGRPHTPAEAKQKLWGAVPAAIDTLVNLLKSGSGVARQKAADSVLDRTIGRPTTVIEHHVGVDWSRVPEPLLQSYVNFYQALMERYPTSPQCALPVPAEDIVAPEVTDDVETEDG